MKWNDNEPAEDIIFNPTLLDVKIEPKSVEQYGCEFDRRFNDRYIPDESRQRLTDADLLNIKLEELCSSIFEAENDKDFAFVEPKACDDAGYDTCTTFSPNSDLDKDWIDSPSSVESFLSSCSEFVDSYQKSNQSNLILEAPSFPVSSPSFSTTAAQPIQDTIPQIAVTPIHQQTCMPTPRHAPSNTHISTPAHLPTQAPTRVPTPAHVSTQAPTHIASPAHVSTQAPTRVPTPAHVSTQAPTHIAIPAHVSTQAPTHVPTPAHVSTQAPTHVPTTVGLSTTDFNIFQSAQHCSKNFITKTTQQVPKVIKKPCLLSVAAESILGPNRGEDYDDISSVSPSSTSTQSPIGQSSIGQTVLDSSSQTSRYVFSKSLKTELSAATYNIAKHTPCC